MNDDARAKMIEASKHYKAGEYKQALGALEGVTGERADKARAAIQRRLADAKPAPGLPTQLAYAFVQLALAVGLGLVGGKLVSVVSEQMNTCYFVVCDRVEAARTVEQTTLIAFTIFTVLGFIIARGLMNKYVR
jgi:hypothetical protein